MEIELSVASVSAELIVVLIAEAVEITIHVADGGLSRRDNPMLVAVSQAGLADKGFCLPEADRSDQVL